MATTTLAQETVELASGRTQVVFRAGEGPPLVWLHPADGIQPEHPVVQALAEHFSVVAPLAPGFADLAELDDVWDVHDLALRYDDIFEALGLEHATVIGHSFGGMVAAELAAHYPNRVGRLVLIAPVGLWNEDYPVTDIFAVDLPDLPGVLFEDEAVAALAFPPAPEGEPDVETTVTLVQGMTSVTKFMWPIPDRGL